MAHYFDIQLRPDPEFPPHLLMAALYGRVHLRLAELKAEDVGLAFPGYQARPAQLGRVMRLVGPAQTLTQIAAGHWLGAVREHVIVHDLLEVPATAEHRRLRRVQAKSNPARLRRRQMKRHGLTEAEALARVPDSAAELLNLPFVQLRSASTGQTFRLFFELGAPQAEVKEGRFNAYGLSPVNTTPWF
ncbi:type I-F CRISPR-associated endoribonuclease Cas6/Csy4 [Roseateles koreensis]|uniref:Type I-F CRISPR-associated endoribonuclease Cas6/Csy4 n=1 Tax=Roseateles koreensis TaxID=2987526 RepID=A0ABT5KN81_9BURK|nr:type I-F CRISPR-associated endoribonuclease Cas6/Csy4 [Roseateles koreensis]MDC8784379.1 type I-F CRISPR-associated endoribonuclease Cas6/Csy4 [Roseateles koreensis]